MSQATPNDNGTIAFQAYRKAIKDHNLENGIINLYLAKRLKNLEAAQTIKGGEKIYGEFEHEKNQPQLDEKRIKYLHNELHNAVSMGSPRALTYYAVHKTIGDKMKLLKQDVALGLQALCLVANYCDKSQFDYALKCLSDPKSIAAISSFLATDAYIKKAGSIKTYIEGLPSYIALDQQERAKSIMTWIEANFSTTLTAIAPPPSIQSSNPSTAAPVTESRHFMTRATLIRKRVEEEAAKEKEAKEKLEQEEKSKAIDMLLKIIEHNPGRINTTNIHWTAFGSDGKLSTPEIKEEMKKSFRQLETHQITTLQNLIAQNQNLIYHISLIPTAALKRLITDKCQNQSELLNHYLLTPKLRTKILTAPATIDIAFIDSCFPAPAPAETKIEPSKKQ